ncbi:DUF397 domain-containing protein [Saccharopolyspora sp. ASAGF58]|uniref:DUF397 domain-containing protein n=1 Tax=Saccharopolyspora sp. ASAGF58 TaxID=2719023 RepID=UPI00143FCD8C|nr:DUF397 domain-containing protein [Saccharopolyspora sp. ASAGF58]
MTGKERTVDSLDLSGLRWRKSTRSSSYVNCVEVAFAGPVVAARDSKDPAGGALLFGAATWSSFVDGLRAGRFDA